MQTQQVIQDSRKGIFFHYLLNFSWTPPVKVSVARLDEIDAQGNDSFLSCS